MNRDLRILRCTEPGCRAIFRGSSMDAHQRIAWRNRGRILCMVDAFLDWLEERDLAVCDHAWTTVPGPFCLRRCSKCGSVEANA